MKNQSATLKKVLRYVRPYRFALIGSLLLALLFVVMSLYIPILVGEAIDFIIGQNEVFFDAMAVKLFQVGLCAAIAALAQWLMSQINNFVTFRVTRDIRDEAFRHIQVLPLSYLDSHPQGDTVSRVISDVDTFADGLLMGFTQLFTGVMTIAGTLILMLTIRPSVALVVIIITPLSLVVANFIATRTYSMFRLQSATRGEQTALIDETIGEMKLVRAFGQEDALLNQFDEINDRLEKCSLRAIFFSSMTNQFNGICRRCTDRCVPVHQWSRQLYGRQFERVSELCQSVYEAFQRNFRSDYGTAECACLCGTCF